MLEVDVRLEAVRERIAAAAERAGRDPGEVTLIAVTKTVDVERITAVLRQGVEHIGENRVQEAEEKFPRLTVPCTKHLIGRLQRNKVGKALELFDLIHSVDRIPLVERLAQRAAGRQVDILLQVNVSGEASKAGVSPDELPRLAEAAAATGVLRVRGLMTMAPYTVDPEETRPVFAALRRLNEALRERGLPNVTCDILSMGMSNDFEVAVEEGATHVRVGSALFA